MAPPLSLAPPPHPTLSWPHKEFRSPGFLLVGNRLVLSGKQGHPSQVCYTHWLLSSLSQCLLVFYSYNDLEVRGAVSIRVIQFNTQQAQHPEAGANSCKPDTML